MTPTIETTIPDPSPAGTPDDAGLLARLKAGEDRAFDDLVAATGGRLFAVARRMLNDDQDAQDAVQDAYLSAFKSLDRFDGRSALATWLHRITVNACLMKLRYRRRHPARPIEDLLPRFMEDGHQTTPNTPWRPNDGGGIQGGEALALVRSMIDQLPDAYREIILLRDLLGLDTQETADVLGDSLSAVKTRLQRARQALRALLDPHFTTPDA